MIEYFHVLFLWKKLEKARQEVKSKDESLRKIEESFQNLESKAKGKDNVYKNQQDKIKELESQLELKTTLHNNSEKQGSQISDKLKEREEICCTLQQKVTWSWIPSVIVTNSFHVINLLIFPLGKRAGK